MTGKKSTLILYLILLMLGTSICEDEEDRKEKSNINIIELKRQEQMEREKAAMEKRAAEDALRKKGAELQLKLDKDHASDPSDRLELSQMVLEELFLVGNNGSNKSISITQLINKYLRASSGEARVHMVKLLKLMDMDLDYYISVEEFVQTLARAFAYPEHAINLIFMLYDQNGNGFLTKYEWVMASMLQSQEDVTVMDLWREASQEFHNRDANSDGLVDGPEFAMYELYDLTYSIGKFIKESSHIIG